MTLARIQIKRGTTSEWIAANPVLASGEIGFDTSTRMFKVGDGTRTWSALGISGGEGHTHTAAQISNLAATLAPYATTASMNTALTSYVTIASQTSTLAGYVFKGFNGTIPVGTTNNFANFQRVADGTSSGVWINMIDFSWKNTNGVVKYTSFFNEFGEFRCAPALTNSVALRIFGKVAPSDPAHVGDVMQLMDDRETRTVLMSIDTDGTIFAPNIGVKVTTGASAPSNPRVGDVWIH